MKSKGYILATLPIGARRADVTIYEPGEIDAFKAARDKAIEDETIRTIYQRWHNGRWSKYSPGYKVMVHIYDYQLPAVVTRKLVELGVTA